METRDQRRSEGRTVRRLVPWVGFTFYLLAALALVYAAAGLYVFVWEGGAATDLVLPAASAVLAGCYTFVGYHLRRYRIWARNFAFAFATVSLFVLPVGTAVGLLVIFCLDRANRARLFTARRLVPRGRVVPFDEGTPLVLRLEPELASERAG